MFQSQQAIDFIELKKIFCRYKIFHADGRTQIKDAWEEGIQRNNWTQLHNLYFLLNSFSEK